MGRFVYLIAAPDQPSANCTYALVSRDPSAPHLISIDTRSRIISYAGTAPLTCLSFPLLPRVEFPEAIDKT